MDMARHNADLAFTRGNDTRTVWTNQAAVAGIKCALHPYHVEDRDPLGNCHDERHASFDRLMDRVGGVGRRYIDHRRIGPVSAMASITELNTGRSRCV